VIGKTIDARSDIFSLGVVLYEALTGVAPFDGDNVNAIMYATVNTTPPPPSSHNRSVPAMLDLIVAKAMAKLLEDRYQSVKEFAEDMREVRRQMDSSRPQAALKATASPVSSRPQPMPAERHVDTATMPMGMEPGQKTRSEDETKPVPLAKTFDSFDATLRLAAMTDQTEDFRDYITATQKMRAYKGKIEATSPLAAQAQAVAPVEERKKAPAFRPAPPAAPALPQYGSRPPGSSTASNVVAVIAIVVLAIAAVALAIALLVK
jgi:serine/threonine-protein kinase